MSEMGNELSFVVDGLQDGKGPKRITDRISKMSGIEFISVDPDRGTITVTGGDLDHMLIEDSIESLGYRLLR